jgi:HK97 family phage major capsid protein
MPHQDPDAPRYSIAKVIRQLAEGGRDRLDGLERETSRELELQGRGFLTPKGVLVPLDAPSLDRRELDTTTGAGSLQTQRHGTLLTALRDRSWLARIGASITVVGAGALTLPRRANTAAIGWADESGEFPEVGGDIEGVTLPPHHVGGRVNMSRSLLKSGPGTEAFIIADLAAAIAAGIDRAGLAGTGADGEPLGLVNNPDVPTFAIGPDGGEMAWGHVVSMEETVAEANAEDPNGAMAYVMSPKVRSKLKRSYVGQEMGVTIWNGAVTGSIGVISDQINGHYAFATKHLPDNLTKGTGTGLSAMLYGNFADLAIPAWGAIDLIVDPYSGNGATVKITAILTANLAPRRPESFVRCLDIATV